MSIGSAPSDLLVTFLADRAQPASRTAAQLAAFLAQAERRLDIAIYDFVLSTASAMPVGEALRGAVARGVEIRLVYESGHTDPRKGPPPPGSTGETIAALGIPARPISTYSALMHHKYV